MRRPLYVQRARALAALVLLGLAGCEGDGDVPAGSKALPVGAELAEALALALTKACPLEGLESREAWEQCADALKSDSTLHASLKQPYLRWGGQTPDAGNDVARSNTTRLDPLVWRRLYLSTFAFFGDERIEQDGARTIAHLPVRFRNALDAGEYPYPFWHSPAKWQSYERTKELLFFIEGDEITAVLRSAEQDSDRPHSEREWDGRWQWNSERGEEPRVALYGFLFAADNPHVEALERAYREFSEKQRTAACTSCHNPSNPSKINPFEFFNFPNQALTARHDIVTQLELNAMPPAAEGAAVGLSDDDYRDDLLQLARNFAALGDKTLAFESARLDAQH